MRRRPIRRGRKRADADNIVFSYSVAFIADPSRLLRGIWTGVSSACLVARAGALCIVRIFAIGAGYHRYFAHRAFRTSRNFQFGLAFLSQTSAQRGILWWAAKHRQHHMHSDTEFDVHSPVLRGFSMRMSAGSLCPETMPSTTDPSATLPSTRSCSGSIGTPICRWRHSPYHVADRRLGRAGDRLLL